MKDLFKPEVLRNLIIVLGIILGIKIFWFIISLLWLPTVDLDQVKKEGSKTLYYHVKLTPNEAPAPVQQKPKPVVRVSGGNIRDIKLLAIYNASDITVVTVEYKKKTKVLSSGDAINGFTLESAGNNYAIFTKISKEYKVMLIKSSQAKTTASITPASPVKAKKSKKTLGKVIDAGNRKIIDRELLDHYATNINDVYKNIGLAEVKEGKDVVGFRIKFVKRDSPFAELGMRRNDVIKSINGQAIDSYSAAFAVYKNLENIDNMSVVIKRGKEEMELEYEIN